MIEEARELFLGTKVRDMVQKRTLVTIDWQDSVSIALKNLETHHILSAPVCKSGKVLGVVDTLDLVAHAVSVINVHQQVDITQETLENLHFEGNLFAGTPVIQVARSPHAKFKMDSTLAEVLTSFATGIHRGLVFEGDQMVNIITQSDVVRHLAMNKETMESALQISLEQLTKEYVLCETKVVTANVNQSTADALKLLQSHTVSGLAVIDDAGKLAAVFSATDLQPLSSSTNFKMLALPILKYLEAVHGLVKTPKVCTMNSHLDDLFFLMAACKLHRIFMIDKDNNLQGVLTLTGIFCFLVRRFLKSGQADTTE